MYIADMHCDSLTTVSGKCGMINSYNFSQKNPQLQFMAHFVKNAGSSVEERKKELYRQLNVYLSESERLGLFRVTNSKDVFSATEGEVRSTLFSIEGGAGLSPDTEELETLFSLGLAVMGLAWDDNEFCASAFSELDTGLTPLGERMVLRCTELGIILDVSHMSDRAFERTVELSPMPLLATHSNFRALCKVKRNLTDDMARKIAARGGVIGINIYPPMLSEQEADMDDILRHIDHGLELLGDSAIGFGFDIDGTDGRYPKGINVNESIHEQVIELMLRHYSTETVEKIAGKNVIEFLKCNLP